MYIEFSRDSTRDAPFFFSRDACADRLGTQFYETRRQKDGVLEDRRPQEDPLAGS